MDLLGMLFFGTLYVTAVIGSMVRGQSNKFIEVLLWRRYHLDFLLFSASVFLFMGMLWVVISDIFLTMNEYAEIAQSRAVETGSHHSFGYAHGNALIAIFGSRTFAAGFFIAALLLWIYFFRIAIKIPAYIDGFNLSTPEAITLTRPVWSRIALVSLFINIGLSSIAVLAPWDAAQWWEKGMLAALTIWIFLHINLAMSVVMYQTYTEGYQMQLLRH